MRGLARNLALVALLPFLSACSETDTEAEQAAPPPPRPVLTMLAAASQEQALGFSGTIEPRFETALAFRTLGRIVSRDVDVGDRVEKGQPLAAIDAETLNADVRSAKAQLANARSQARTSEASEGRARTLFNENAVSQADLELAQQASSVAAAELESAQAQLDKAENALTYAVLTAPYDGVITSREADIGQVASAGATVMRLARTDQREAVVDVPDGQAADLKPGAAFRVTLQIEPALSVSGTVREIAPQADAITRTLRVRILLEAPPEAFRLGALINAVPLDGAASASIVLPQTAVFEEDGKSMVWIVDETAKTVRKRTIETKRTANGSLIVTKGLEPDERVVIAGVHSLQEGQPVGLAEMAESRT